MTDTVSRRRRRVRLIAAVAAAGALLFLLLGPLRRGISAIQSPFAAAGTWAYAHTFGVFEPAAAGTARVSALEAERAALAVDRAELERLKSENDDLRARLGFAKRTGFAVVSADVVARDGGPQSNRFSIDRGSRDGVAAGMAVITGDGVLAGKVIDVSDAGATVAAVTDRGVATAVSLFGGARTVGVARGLDGTLLSLDFIPKDETVAVNDLAVTSGLEDRVPSGLVVGLVNAVESKDTEPFKRAILEPLADVRRVSSVTVVLGRAP